MKEPTKAEEQTPEEKRVEAMWERWDRFFWRTVSKFLRDLFIAVMISITITLLVYVFILLIERLQ